MKPLQIAICDDLEEERVILSRMLRNYARRQGLSLQVHFFVSGEELLRQARQAAETYLRGRTRGGRGAGVRLQPLLYALLGAGSASVLWGLSLLLL